MLSMDHFGLRLKKLRQAKHMSRRQLAEALYVTPSTVSRWELGMRTPDVETLVRLARCLSVSPAELLSTSGVDDNQRPTVILVDDEPIVLSGCLLEVQVALPMAQVEGFSSAEDALDFVRSHRVDVAILDIELGHSIGLTLCRQMMKLQPELNVIFLTAYPEYAIQAWDTLASGFLIKPLEQEQIRTQMAALRHPVPGLLVQP